MVKQILATLGIGIFSVILVMILFTRVEVLSQFAEIIREKSISSTQESKPISAFGENDSTKINEKTKLSEDIEIAYKNKPSEYLAFKYGWGLLEIPQDRNWDHKNIPVLAKILKVNGDNTLEIKLTSPKNVTDIEKNRTFNLSLCKTENTYVSVEDYVVTKRLDFLEDIAPDMELITFCANSQCTKFEKLCKIFM